MAKPFSASRRVRNHYSKRILNLILNRKRFLRRENDPLDKQNPRQNRRGPDPPRTRLSESMEHRRARMLRRKTRLMEGRGKATRARSRRI